MDSPISFEVVLFPASELAGSAELALGRRELCRRLPMARAWHRFVAGPDPAEVLALGEAPWLLLVLEPALLAADNLGLELAAVAAAEAVECVLPVDQRGTATGLTPDYHNRSGLEDFVASLRLGPRQVAYDGREPLLYLVERNALARLYDEHRREFAWAAVPAWLDSRSRLAGWTFVHSYADYHEHQRREMLPLVPPDVKNLLDVGGGKGRFARAFMAARGGRAVLLETDPRAVAEARRQGLPVLEGDLMSLAAPEQFDCLSLLDVLEHLPDSLAALIRVHDFLIPGGALLLSVPNIGHWSVAWDLLEGVFAYQPVGILCQTHLRFFTRSSLATLLADAGFKVEKWEDVSSPMPGTLREFLAAGVAPTTAGSPGRPVKPDWASLETASFRVLARRD